MASETTDRGETRIESESSNQGHDVFFASAQHEHDDGVFNGAHADHLDAATEPVQQVPIDQGAHVIRVNVTPGEILELSSPFDPGADLVGREANGNLAIKVGDVTVILEGFVTANDQAPVVVETSDGKPIDIAVLLASTDPNIDIQTAAGPAAGPQGGQGADNTGAILALLQGGAGLGGFNAIGAQDQTSLTYGTIDNSIIQDRFLTANLATAAGSPGFGGMQEPFLRDPAMQVDSSWMNFNDFLTAYKQYLDSHQGDTPAPGGWADYKGTSASATDTDAFLAETSQTIVISHSSGSPESLHFDLANFFANGTPQSDQHDLEAHMLAGDPSTVVLTRSSDGAIVMVFHVEESSTTGDFHVETFLINRLDHATPDPSVDDSVQDILSIEFNTLLYDPNNPSQEEQTPQQGPVGTVQVLDDVPTAGTVGYTSFFGQDPVEVKLAGGGGNDIHSHHHASFDSTAAGFGYVDEDWVKGSWGEHNQGNKDQDNTPPGSNSDPAHGDDLGRNYTTGTLNIDFGADGPAGAGGGGNDHCFTLAPVDTQIALELTNIPQPKTDQLKDANGAPLTSSGHEIVVLEHYTDGKGIEHLVAGYVIGGTSGGESGAGVTEGKASGDSFFGDSSSGGECVKVFELTLDVNPDDNNGKGLDFQDFKFELFRGIDQDPGTATPESNTLLKFDVLGHDDDGDAVHTEIKVQVNDDVPVAHDTCYVSFSGGHDMTEEGAFGILSGLGGGGGYVIKSTDFGQVDEDWLKGGGGNDANTNGTGNHDHDGTGASNAQQQGDEHGTTKVFGLLNIDFGGDGPADPTNPATPNGPLALKTYDTSDPDNLQTFTDATHPDGYTTDGHTLVVLESSTSHIEVGYIPTGSSGDEVYTPVPIFTLDLVTDPTAWNFGGFEFCLKGPIDQPNTPAVDDNGDPIPEGNSPTISFDVTATDGDGDTTHPAINIQVNDDKPEILVSYTNQDPGEVITSFVHTSGIDTVATYQTHDYGQVDEDWLNATSVTPAGNQDADGANVNGDTKGGTVVTGQLTAKFGADGPSDTTNGFALTAVDATTHPVFVDANQHSFKSQDHDLVVLSSSDGQLSVGYYPDPAAKLVAVDIVAAPEPIVIFTITVNSDGSFEFDLKGPIDHDPASNPDNGDPETNTLISFAAGSATDKDGDTTPAIININVNDDHPLMSADYVSQQHLGDHDTSTTPEIHSSAFGSVDEDFIVPGGNQNSDRNNGDTIGDKTVTGNLTFSYGADGPGAGVGTAGFTAQEGDVVRAKDDNGNTIDLKTDDGKTVYVHIDGNTLTGYTKVDDTQGFDGNQDKEVFKLDLTSTGAGQASFTFLLEQAVQHPNGDSSSGTPEDNLFLSIGVAAGEDFDHDPATGTIHIRINDDSPLAVDDLMASGVYAGNVIKDPAHPSGDDYQGADGASITFISGVTAGAVTDQGATTVHGLFGDLTIQDNGVWSYHLNGAEDNVADHDTFTYTLTDGDGDTSTASLKITIPSIYDEPGAGTSAPAAHYDLTLNVTKDTDATTNAHYHAGDNVKITDTDTGLFGTGFGAGHTLKGGSGDDLIFGNAGNDDIYGRAGHDAQSGGNGDDTFHKVDAADLDGSHTLADGIHTIDGGDGYDTADLSGLASFNSSQAGKIENVEHLAFDGTPTAGTGTAVTLSYDAAYNVTQVGGIHVLSITGDAGKDTVNLTASNGNSWHSDGTVAGNDIYHAGSGAAFSGGDTVTVTVEHGVQVTTS